MIEIPFPNGLTAIIDDEDAHLLEYAWRACIFKSSTTAYVVRSDRDKKVLMHRQIMGFPENKSVDHVNRNGLDNRRCNLRIAPTGSHQQLNRGAQKNNRFGLKGIKPYGRGLYSVQIHWKGTGHRLYGFKDVLSAKTAYNELAVRLAGSFAYLHDLEEVKVR